jgi:molecular chaperone GrpE
VDKKHDKPLEESGDTNKEVQAEDVAEAAGAETVEQLKEALAAKETEAAANWDKFVRERADLENFRKRVQKEKEEILKYGNESLLTDIIPVIDNMERALSHACDDICDEKMNAVLEGIRLTHGMLLGTLKKFGVTPLETERGAPFDPAFHQAMCQVESAELPPNSIVEEFQRGYLLNERLLRPAMVSVAIAPKNGE